MMMRAGRRLGRLSIDRGGIPGGKPPSASTRNQRIVRQGGRRLRDSHQSASCGDRFLVSLRPLGRPGPGRGWSREKLV